MDEFLDQFFSSSSWSDANETVTDLVGTYVGDDKKSPVNLNPSSHIIENLATEGTSLLVTGDSNYVIDKDLLTGEPQSQKEVLDQERKLLSSEVMVDDNTKTGYMDLQLNNGTSDLGTVNHSSPELLPIFGGSSQSPCAPPESGSVGSNDTEASGIHPSLRDSHSITSIPQLWPTPSYGGVSSLSPALVQDTPQGFGLPGHYVDTDANIFENRCLGDDKSLQMGKFPASISGQDELHSHFLSSFAANHSLLAGLHSQLQLPQLSERNSMQACENQSLVSQLLHAPTTASGGCNRAVKPRVRARRGQATDPHSIAERLRREKIADRMKNLQELVPNSNKADKASMLDEIIEYVKFLQLQVKVLSMSRLGAAGAVVPLITECQAEGNAGLHLSPSGGHGAVESPDDIAFEEEVVKLMESNVTAAMQYLQGKGLCLMPIALATAISSRKKTSSNSFSVERPTTNLNFPNGFLPQNSGSAGGIANGQISADGKIGTKENVVDMHEGQEITSNGCNRSVVKQEETTTNSAKAKA